mgnify:CR=1 FL=1
MHEVLVTRMGRTPLWTAIRDTLRDEIAAGRYSAGDQLPTEARLADRFGVNRHTVRRALAGLGEAGIVHARRGAGVFVAQPQTMYPLGRRVRFHRNLLAAGREPRRQVLNLEQRKADMREAEALKLPQKALVQVFEGLSFADAVPIAVFRSVFPAGRFPGMLKALGKTPSVTAAFKAMGLTDYTRAGTEITAKRASPTIASHLAITSGDPILRTVSVNIDPDGRAIEYGRTWFAGDRIAFSIGEMPEA